MRRLDVTLPGVVCDRMFRRGKAVYVLGHTARGLSVIADHMGQLRNLDVIHRTNLAV